MAKEKKNYGKSTELFVYKTNKATFAIFANLRKPTDDLFCRVVGDDSKFRLDLNDFASKGKGNSEHSVYNIDMGDMLELYEKGRIATLFNKPYQLNLFKIIGSAEENGTCPTYHCSIFRDPSLKNSWGIKIENGRAKPQRYEGGACQEQSGTFQKNFEGKVFMNDRKFLEMINCMYEKWREVGLVYTMQSIGSFEEVYATYQRGDYNKNLVPERTDENPFVNNAPAPAASESLFEDVPAAAPEKPAEPVPAPAETQKPEIYNVTAIINSDFTAVSGVYVAECIISGKKGSVYFKEPTPELIEARKTGKPVKMQIELKHKNDKKLFLCKEAVA